MERIKARIIATASIELVAWVKKYRDGYVKLDEILDIIDIDDIDDIEIKSEIR